jgi:hypothetical protein
MLALVFLVSNGHKTERKMIEIFPTVADSL